mmetsp:Transcript_7074/g.10133  ORF Transcript_7074/g.10133 Transcript_7074/m.10133 type:complete len:124 (+) Transcript_7074:91-462(+)
MASRALAPLVRRSVVATRASQNALKGGTPPLAPFARIPAPTQKLSEQNDCVFDDGVAPELALDFDCQHVSSNEGLASWLGGLSFFVLLYKFVETTDPRSQNPAVNRIKNDMVMEAPKAPSLYD